MEYRIGNKRTEWETNVRKFDRFKKYLCFLKNVKLNFYFNEENNVVILFEFLFVIQTYFIILFINYPTNKALYY